MPNEHVDIARLNEHGRDRLREREAERRWLEENPGARPPDYAAQRFRPAEYTPWREHVDNDFDRSELRRMSNLAELPDLRLIDRRAGTEGRLDKLVDPQLEILRRGIAGMFSDLALQASGWNLPLSDAATQTAWSKMVENTRPSVERSADRLSACLGETLALIVDRIRGDAGSAGDAAAAAWRDSELAGKLDALQTALRGWDELLARDPLPTADALEIAAEACAARYKEVATAHRMAYQGKDMPPIVRFQLLATLQQISRVQSERLALRVAQPSFTGVFQRLGEFSTGAVLKDASDRAETLRRKADAGLGKLWDKELTDLRATHKQVLRNELKKTLGSDQAVQDRSRATIRGLDAALQALAKERPPVDLANSLKRWGQAVLDLAKPDRRPEALAALNELAGDLVHGMRRHRETLDAALLRPLDFSAGEAALKAQRELNQAELSVRERYMALMDGVARMCQEDVRFAKGLLGN
jgi:hypothetical protein